MIEEKRVEAFLKRCEESREKVRNRNFSASMYEALDAQIDTLKWVLGKL